MAGDIFRQALKQLETRLRKKGRLPNGDMVEFNKYGDMVRQTVSDNGCYRSNEYGDKCKGVRFYKNKDEKEVFRDVPIGTVLEFYEDNFEGRRGKIKSITFPNGRRQMYGRYGDMAECFPSGRLIQYGKDTVKISEQTPGGIIIEYDKNGNKMLEILPDGKIISCFPRCS